MSGPTALTSPGDEGPPTGGSSCSVTAGNERLEPADLEPGTAHELTLRYSGFYPWCGTALHTER